MSWKTRAFDHYVSPPIATEGRCPPDSMFSIHQGNILGYPWVNKLIEKKWAKSKKILIIA